MVTVAQPVGLAQVADDVVQCCVADEIAGSEGVHRQAPTAMWLLPTPGGPRIRVQT